jgi:hypothetical protein
MRNRTRVVIRIDDSSGAQLVDGNTSIEFKILPDTSAQIQAGKQYLIYLTKVYKILGAAGAVNEIYGVSIDGLSSQTNNLNLNSTVQNLPVIGLFNLSNPSTNTGLLNVVWENPHPKEDGIVCSNPFNKRLLLKFLKIDGTYETLNSKKYVIEFMVEEICDC